MSVYDISAISLMSAPAANTFSPPYTMTARTSSRSDASVAAARISSWTVTLSAFIGGRSRRMVATPSATSRCTNSAMAGSVSDPRRGADASDQLAPVWQDDPVPRPDPPVLVWPGHHQDRGATYDGSGHQLRGLGARGHPGVRLPVRRLRATRRGSRLPDLTLGVWHGYVPGVEPGQRYGFRADGPWDPPAGHLFNPDKLLLDPYARAIDGELIA